MKEASPAQVRPTGLHRVPGAEAMAPSLSWEGTSILVLDPV